MYISYAWVSTRDQRLSLQLDAPRAAGCAKVFVEQASGVQHDRPQQQAALDCGRLSDTLVAWNLDRLARQLWVAPSTLYHDLPGGRSALREERAQRVG
jgi:DNA invertase Pin-like site-specific DNA recombinase